MCQMDVRDSRPGSRTHITEIPSQPLCCPTNHDPYKPPGPLPKAAVLAPALRSTFYLHRQNIIESWWSEDSVNDCPTGFWKQTWLTGRKLLLAYSLSEVFLSTSFLSKRKSDPHWSTWFESQHLFLMPNSYLTNADLGSSNWVLATLMTSRRCQCLGVPLTSQINIQFKHKAKDDIPVDHEVQAAAG